MKVVILWLVALVYICSIGQTYATQSTNEVPLRIAVSSNFAPILNKILPQFHQETGIKTQVISSATGTLYLQIKHGAPFDVFLSADDIHPQRLVDENLAIGESLHTYAVGQLALFSITEQADLAKAQKQITHLSSTHKTLTEFISDYLKNSSHKFAIANPNNAPYGKAAQQVLTNLSLWQRIQKRLVTGININQTFGQVRSQAVSMGIVAQSQLVLNNLPGWLIPKDLYHPIKQQLVILNSSKQKQYAQKLNQYLLSKPVQQLIVDHGYANKQVMANVN